MKKIILAGTALAMCVTLTACGSGKTDATISDLSRQLDQTANTVSSVRTATPNELSINLDSYATQNSVEKTQNAIMDEEYLKMEVLQSAGKIKNNLANVKLSKAQIGAVKELTDSLTKYTNSVELSKNEMNSTIKSISSLKRNTPKNAEKLNAKLNILQYNSNTRASYYENILNILDEIETLTSNQSSSGQKTRQNSEIFEYSQNFDQNFTYPTTEYEKHISLYECPECGKTFSTDESDQNGVKIANLCPSCGKVVTDSNRIFNYNSAYRRYNNIQNTEDKNIQNSESVQTASEKNPTIPQNPEYYKPNSNNINRRSFMGNFYGMNGAYGNGIYNNGYNGIYNNGFNGMYGYGAPYNNPYMYNGRMNGYSGIYNGMYGPGNFSRFNLNRNTDTYAPLIRNIDTYRPVEEKKDDETIETDSKQISEEKKPEKRLESVEEINKNGELAKSKDLKQQKSTDKTTNKTLSLKPTTRNVSSPKLKPHN